MDNKRMFSAPLELLERVCMLPSKESMLANHQGVIDRGRAQDELRALLAQPSTQHHSDPVLIQAVAVTRTDDEDGLRLEWLLEGGIAEMEFPGQVLFAMTEANDLCDEDGSAYVYLQPPAQAAAQHQGDPDRALKDALFACLAAGGDDRVYGGVATTGDRQGWVRFTAVAAGAQHQGEPVYQLRNTVVGNIWRDADKEAYDSAAKLVEYERRVLYTRPDAGEVERPSQIALSLQAKLKSVESERDTLRAQLASATGLLRDHQWHYEPYDDHYHRDAGHYCPSCGGEEDAGHKANCDIAAALSASAEQEVKP